MGTPRIRIVVADDHRILREGLCRLLEIQPGMEVVGEADDGDVAIELVTALKPDILLLDLAMPRLPGVDTLRQLSRSGVTVRTILLTAAAESATILEALQLGARGVVLKHAAPEVLFRSIRSVMAGELWIGREFVSNIVQALRSRKAKGPRSTARPLFGLTPRELEITATIAAGYANKDIAQKLSVTEDTVKHHLTSIFDKTGVTTRLELAVLAVNHHLEARE